MADLDRPRAVRLARRFVGAVYRRLLAVLAFGDLPRRLAMARSIGMAANRWHIEGPTAREVTDLFGNVPALTVARELAARRFQNRVLRRVVRSERRSALPVVERVDLQCVDDLSAQNRPAILLSFHVGLIRTIPLALTARGIDVFPVARIRSLDVAGRAAKLKLAMEHLERNGMVLIALDGVGTSTQPVRFLGRAVSFRRGPALLARVSGAPVVPVVAKWISHKGTIQVIAGEPLQLPATAADPASFERALTESAARWLERYLRSAPEELQLGRFRALLRTPRA